MNQSQLISSLDELLPEIHRTRDPESVLLKHAKAKNLAPAVLVKLAQTWNTAKSLTVMNKAATRGSDFELIDTEELLAKYESPAPRYKQASTIDEGDVMRFPGTWKDEETVKAASVPFAETRARIIDETLELQMLEQIVDDQREALFEGYEKVADAMREHDIPFAKVEEVAIAFLGKDAASMCDHLAKFVTNKHLPASRMEKAGAFVRDPFNLKSLLTPAFEAYELCKTASTMAREKQQQREDKPPKPKGDVFDEIGKANRPGKPPGGASSSGNSASPSPARSEKPSGGGGLDIGNSLNRSVGEVSKGVTGPYQAISSLLGELKAPNKRQELRDTAVNDETAFSGLQDLMSRDAVISEADPRMVVDLFNSLRRVNPSATKDVNFVRFALREALQYGALPQHTMKDLYSMRESEAKSLDYERKNRDAEYA